MAGGCGGSVGSADGSAAETCGPGSCASGEHCCDPSCGICSTPGVGCVVVECRPECAPQDARQGRYGYCEGPALWIWNGGACVQDTDCGDCYGTDCDDVFYFEADCLAAYSHCPQWF
jgi:hypothetical protein